MDYQHLYLPPQRETPRRLQENVNGPWEECVGMQGEACKAHILQQNPTLESENVKIAYPRKFNYYRIWINIDENGIVSETPGRG